MKPSGALENLAAVAPGNLAPVPPPSGELPAIQVEPTLLPPRIPQLTGFSWYSMIRRGSSCAVTHWQPCALGSSVSSARSERRPPIDAPDLRNCFCSFSVVAFGERGLIESPCSLSEYLGNGPGALPPLCGPAYSRAVKADLSKCCFRYENTPTIPRP